jgi:hypothetical protein
MTSEWRLRAALSDFAFSFGEYCTRGAAHLCTITRDDHGARKKKVKDHTQGYHFGMFITCVPFGFHNGMDESFSSQQQEVGGSFPPPQTIIPRRDDLEHFSIIDKDNELFDSRKACQP